MPTDILFMAVLIPDVIKWQIINSNSHNNNVGAILLRTAEGHTRLLYENVDVKNNKSLNFITTNIMSLPKTSIIYNNVENLYLFEGG